MTATMTVLDTELMRGDLVCLNCGRFLGTVEREAGKPIRLINNPERQPQAEPRRNGASGIRCSRCGGRAIVEGLEKYRPFPASRN